MRAIGLILVLIGGLVLGYSEFASRTQNAELWEADQAINTKDPRNLPSVVGGIALVGGLLLLASDPRQEENCAPQA